jgi:hypothetical protein
MKRRNFLGVVLALPGMSLPIFISKTPKLKWEWISYEDEYGWIQLIHEFNHDAIHNGDEPDYEIVNVQDRIVRVKHFEDRVLMKLSDWDMGKPPIKSKYLCRDGTPNAPLRDGAFISFTLLGYHKQTVKDVCLLGLGDG